MDNNTITAISTIALVIVGTAQAGILISQRKQTQIILSEYYRKKWNEYRKHWGVIIFFGREVDEYYQVVDQDKIDSLKRLERKANCFYPTIWARDSSRLIFTMLSDVCLKILHNQIYIHDVYPIFGTEILRQSKPLRILLDTYYTNKGILHDKDFDTDLEKSHTKVRKEIQDLLTYHDGIRRRCLILIDLLWAEASRLEDLPPTDLKSAADAKINSGSLCRKRVFSECIRLNGFKKIFHAYHLSYFLRNSEYKNKYLPIGIDKIRLEELNQKWENRLLNNFKS